MVTGGEDKRVNLFAIGKPQAVLSMTGHQSPVECVTFDRAEEVVVAGAAGGTLKLWDLEQAKVVRTLVGHRSNAIAVDFHPFGEFFASGSLDTNVKIWDVRRKGCIHTYKGHDRGVGVTSFSPDGKWVVSGGMDGKVKLWDLTAGKLLKQLTTHDGPVTSIEFHPNELLVATGSSDRTVKFWDLESFEQVDEVVEATGVKSMLFHPDGANLLTGTSEFLKIWNWEPSTCRDAVDVSWKNLSDLSTHENKLLGASISNSFVGVWVVDLNQCEPFHSGAERGPGGGGTRDADRELRSKQTAEETALVAVAAAAEASKARVLRSEREAAVVRDAGFDQAEAEDTSTSNAKNVSDRLFDARDIAREEHVSSRSPMSMNLKFAAAHGIGDDPLVEPPPMVVVNKKPEISKQVPSRPSEPKGDERRATQVLHAKPEEFKERDTPEEIPEEYSEEFETKEPDIVAEDSLENVNVEACDDEMTRALGLSVDPEPEPAEPDPSFCSPRKPPSAKKKFQSPSRASPRKSYEFGENQEAFNLEALRSAALEVDTEFIDANGDTGNGDSISIETLAVAMSRARAEREGDEDTSTDPVGASLPSTQSPRAAIAMTLSHMHQQKAPISVRSPLGVDFASFVPGARLPQMGTPNTPLPDETEMLLALSGKDDELIADIYSQRLYTLRATSRAWVKGDTRGVSSFLANSGDHSALSDVLRSALEAPYGGIVGDGAVTLDLAANLVPLCGVLLNSPHSHYQDVALRFSRRVLFAFEPVLIGAKQNSSSNGNRRARGGIGVDLAGEERIARAATTRVALLGQRDALVAIEGGMNNDLAVKAREMLGAMERLA